MTPTAHRVGVVVPVREGVEHLSGTLSSLLSQRPQPDEIVVIDGRGDGACQAETGNCPLVQIVDQTAQGLGAARNQGIAATTADLIAFCDVDDRWSEGALALRFAHLNATPACDAVIGHHTTFAFDGDSVPDRRAEQLGVPMPGYTPGALMMRRPTFQRIGQFDETLSIGTDTDWFIRLATSDLQLDVLDDIVLYKGVRSNSLSTNIKAYQRELLTIVRAHLNRHRKG